MMFSRQAGKDRRWIWRCAEARFLSAATPQFQKRTLSDSGCVRQIWRVFAAEIVSLLRQLLSHQPVQQIERFERARHHLEMRDAAVIARRDHVDAVDPDAVELAFELKHRPALVPPFADKGKAGAAKDRHGTGE